MTHHGRPIRRRTRRGLASTGTALAVVMTVAMAAALAAIVTVAAAALAAGGAGGVGAAGEVVAASGTETTGGVGAASGSHTGWTARGPIPAPATRTLGEPARAGAARTLTVDDNGKLHLLHASGSILSEAGPVSGTLLGTAKVSLNVGEDVTATFTIHAHGGGSIVGHGSAVLHSAGRYSSFAGSLTVTGGTGRYAHAHGAGKLYGTLERRYDEVVFQTRGTLDY
jgi:hypothetical protein